MNARWIRVAWILTLCCVLGAARAGAATLTYKVPTGYFFNDPGAWDLGYVPGPTDSVRYTNAPGAFYITYFPTASYTLDKVEIKTSSGIGRSRFYSNPQFGASLLITNRIDIYTDGTTSSDAAGMTWEYIKQLDVTNGAGTAVVEVGNRARLQVFGGYDFVNWGTARVDRLISTNVESLIQYHGGELQTKRGVDIRQQSGNFSIGDTWRARWLIQGGTNTITLPSNAYLYLGAIAAASNSLFEISGAGTVYSNPVGNTTVGLNAYDARMVIRDGARVYLSDASGFLRVGNSRRGRLEVTGSNTLLQLRNGIELASGLAGTNSYFEVSGGAAVVATAVDVGDFGLGVWGSESTTLVTGAGTWLSGSNMNIQLGQTTLAKGTRLIVSSGAVAVAKNLLVSWAAGASNNHAQVEHGGVLRVNALYTRSGAYGTISNVGGVYQFRIPAPGIQPAGGPISIENGTISHFYINAANVIRSGTDFTNMTFYGTNTFQLVNSSNHPSISQTYTFSTALGAANYSRLEMVEGGTLYRNGAATIGSGGSFMASNTLATFSSNLNITADGVAWVQPSATVSAYKVTMSGSAPRLLVDGALTGVVEVSSGTVTNNGAMQGTLTLYGGTLAGAGLYSGDFTLYGGTIHPTLFGPAAVNGSILPGGNATGTLTIAGNVTWNGSTSYSTSNDWYFQLGAPGVGDRLVVTGSFTKGVGSIFRFDFGGASTLGTYTLVTWTASTTFSPSDFDYVNLGSGRGASFTMNANELVVTINSCTAPTVTLGAGPTVCQGATTGTVSFSTTGSPIEYSLDFSAAANAQGFADVLTTSLGPSPLGISVPPSAAVGVYTAALTVVNAGGCRATSNFTVTVVNTPAQPAGITQPSPAATTVCAASSGVVYSISAVFGATNYVWTVPAGATILSGQGSTAISLDWGSVMPGAAPIKVRAENACGISPELTNSFTVLGGVPGVPTAQPGSEISLSSFMANWSAATGTVANYRLDVATSADFSGGFVLSNLTVAGTSYFVSGLDSGETYYYRVRAQNACGASDNSSAVAVLTLQLLAAWDVSTLPGGAGNYGASPLPATTYATGHVTVAGLLRGPGVTAAGTAAARGWGGTAWNSGSAGAAVTAGQYATTVVEVVSGRFVSFLDINPLTYRRPAGGPPSGVLQYSVDGSTYHDITNLTYSSTSDSGGSLAVPIGLSGIAALQNVAAGTPVTFRIVNYGAGSATEPWYLYDTGNSASNDFAIRGAICVTPNAYGISGGGTYCSSGSGVAIGLSNSQLRVSYQLYRENGGSPIPVGSSVIGTGGAISFGTHSVTDTYTVVATRDAGGCTNAMMGSVTVSVIATPNAPTNLVLFVTNNQVDVSWTAPTGTVTGYNVKRSEVSGGPYTTIVTNHGSTNFSDTGVFNGNTYYYRVSALNAGCEGGNSDEETAVMPAGCPGGQTPTLTQPGNRTVIVPGSLTLFSLTASELSGGCPPPNLSHSTLPAWMGYSDVTSGASRTRSYTGTPLLTQTGAYPITVTATDGELNTTNVTFVIYVGYSESGHGGSAPPPSQTNWTVAITNVSPVSSGNATLVWEAVNGVRYDIWSTTANLGSSGIAWDKLASSVANASMASQLVTASGSQRYYKVVPEGQPINSNGVWAIIKPSIAPGFNSLSVPVELTNRSFNGSFGAALAAPLTGNNIHGLGDEVFILNANNTYSNLYLDASKVWRTTQPGNPVSTYELSPGQGFIVLNRTLSTVQPEFRGPVGNRSVSTNTIPAGGYTIIGLSEGKYLNISSAFSDIVSGSGPAGSFDETQADTIIIMQSNGSYIPLQRLPNGTWLDLTTFSTATQRFTPGVAYWYVRTPTGNTFRVRF
jgi:hypothetical protein